ncbi:MAG: hypothetical protein Q7S40_01585 [Opitutaceae bacterium]|nr:hypothetical protein [Opitutaceae bacterium]
MNRPSWGESTPSARQMCRRVRQRCPRARVIIGIWQHRAKLEELSERVQPARPDSVVTTLASAIDEIEHALGRTDVPMKPAPGRDAAKPPPPPGETPPPHPAKQRMPSK